MATKRAVDVDTAGDKRVRASDQRLLIRPYMEIPTGAEPKLIQTMEVTRSVEDRGISRQIWKLRGHLQTRAILSDSMLAVPRSRGWYQLLGEWPLDQLVVGDDGSESCDFDGAIWLINSVENVRVQLIADTPERPRCTSSYPKLAMAPDNTLVATYVDATNLVVSRFVIGMSSARLIETKTYDVYAKLCTCGQPFSGVHDVQVGLNGALYLLVGTADGSKPHITQHKCTSLVIVDPDGSISRVCLSLWQIWMCKIRLDARDNVLAFYTDIEGVYGFMHMDSHGDNLTPVVLDAGPRDSKRLFADGHWFKKHHGFYMVPCGVQVSDHLLLSWVEGDEAVVIENEATKPERTIKADV